MKRSSTRAAMWAKLRRREAREKAALTREKKELRAVLDKLDRILATEDRLGGLASKLWDVLSAMRGPDNEDASLKDSITIPIRRKAFPRTFKKGGISRAFFGYRNEVYPFKVGVEFTHFNEHGRRAARALGLYKEPNQ